MAAEESNAFGAVSIVFDQRLGKERKRDALPFGNRTMLLQRPGYLMGKAIQSQASLLSMIQAAQSYRKLSISLLF